MINVHLPKNLIEFSLKEADPNKGFVYFLFDENDKLLYIGQTIYLENRISTHLKKNLIPFSKCKYIECLKGEMCEIEFEYIVINCPPYNGPPPISKNWLSLEQAKRKFPNFKGKISQLKQQLKKNQHTNFHGYYRVNDIISIHEFLFGDQQ